MIIVMNDNATETDLNHVVDKIRSLGYKEHVIKGTDRTVVAALGDERNKSALNMLQSFHGVDDVLPILKPYKLVSKETGATPKTIEIGNVKIGGGYFAVMAGPCSVENEKQILEIAEDVKNAGAQILRGGAFKPRTSPYAFQGLEEEGLKLLAKAREATGLLIVTEVMTPDDVELVAEYADILQIGARNMQNYSLLKKVGTITKPILLKRGLAATVEELLMSAEYIMSQGNYNVILCERGIRTYETITRNTLDLNAVPAIKKVSNLPIIVDPSHGTGRYDLVLPMAKAAVASGADGLMIEVHNNPEEAFSDGSQSLLPKHFDELMNAIKPFVELEGKKLS